MTRKITNYTLTVTAGPTRDISSHVPVPVNTEQPLHFDTNLISTDLFVRIQNYRGTDKTLPSTSPYFETPPHSTNKDKYSISFSPLIFKDSSINGDDLVLGNDFDEPISKNLPPGFSVAWRVARWVVDPGLDGDPWAEKPWLEGRVLSSVNVIDIGDRDDKKQAGEGVDVLEEGLYKSKLNAEEGSEEEIPKDGAARMKFFVQQEKRKKFVFEKGEKYWMDFYNPYLDFNEFALHLPGISIHILQYWDGQPLRYVLKNRVDQTVYLVVQFTLTPKEDVDTDEEDEDDDGDDEEDDEGDDEIFEDARQSEGTTSQKSTNPAVQTSNDDID
ncbi:hypothetical protein AOL_s00215g341 [Orbilia oligospora ATCC 24927]|uniref:Domain of unknown function at the cortex 1 domain-containing protein n=1 Tax=Arthrobotrys oligospora (strain ATCC 24927 / CBS 115.81 / DSM 1491) TaxID=756982 RepID=G1XU62_ARTOA|nr:hypothetical protein AOL_s00215g341 [Orbilia oligospora ATCC 24927]EGX43605.1 hypothetical protein AOL_s00215g341 [Orbilia oligospora ATCC 24927]